MTNPQSTPEPVVWVSIDVAKDRHEALIEAPGWKCRKKFRVQNTAEEFRAFAEFPYGLNLPVRIGFEPTGNYHRALAYFLHSEGFPLELFEPLRARHFFNDLQHLRYFSAEHSLNNFSS